MCSASRTLLACGAMIGLMLLRSEEAPAAPGDLHRVVGERVNLRAGPSDDTNVRSQIVQGEELVELQRDGNWYGVRALRTGEEGWIYGDLIELEAATSLGGGDMVPAGAGFADLSRDFDNVMGHLSRRLGYPLVSEVAPSDGNELRVRMSDDWLRRGSEAEHLLGAAAIYQMWKNHQNSAPVRVVLLDPAGEQYATLDEIVQNAPLVTLEMP